jgi:threonine dehydratase
MHDGPAEPTLADVEAAARRIEGRVHRTPVLTCATLDEIAGATLFFKCENLQKVGAFKIRGATNTVFQLDAGELARGVATHSSGNHGAALALAARWRGTTATIVMPRNAPRPKKDAVQHYGGKIVECEPTLRAREDTLASVVRDTGATFVHPYDDHRIIAGQGTAALELCEDVADLDVVMAPVGGGGLLSGTAIAVTARVPRTEVVGTEPAMADDAYRSFQAGRILPVEDPRTIADGLRTSLGSRTFPIIRRRVTDIVTVSEEQIIAAMRLLWERMKLIVEPSAAVPLGAVLAHRARWADRRVGILLSGGNVDLDHLPWAKP